MVGLAAGKSREDLELSLGQRGTDGYGGGIAGLDGDVQLTDALKQLAGDLRGDHRFSRSRGLDGVDDRFRGRALEDVAARARDDCFDDAVLLAAGEHQHARGWGE